MPVPAASEQNPEASFAAVPPAHNTDPNATSLASRFAGDPNTTPRATESRWGLPNGPIEPQTATPNEKSPPETKTPPADDGKGKPAAADAAKPKDGAPSDGQISDDEIEKLTPDAGRSWKTLKNQLKLARTERANLLSERTKLSDEIKTLQSQAKQAETPAELSEIKQQLEQVQRERDEINTVLKTALYQHSPEFQKKFAAQREGVMELAKRTLSSEVFAQAKEIFKLAPGEYRDRLLSELSDNLSTAQRGRLDALTLRWDEINMQQEADLAEGAKRYEEWQQSQQSVQQKRLKEYETLFTDVLSNLQNPKTGIDIFFKAEDPKRQAEIDEMVEVARNAWTGKMEVKKMATLQLWGAAFPNLLKQTQAYAKKVSELQAELDSLKASTPGIKSGSKDADVSSDDQRPRDGESMAMYLARVNPSGKF